MTDRMTDHFRPHREPARTLYDALLTVDRDCQNTDEWILAERLLMWETARDYAQQHGLKVPTMKEVECAESRAEGHVDYAAKWAYGIARVIENP